jgi:hypothetical protein
MSNWYMPDDWNMYRIFFNCQYTWAYSLHTLRFEIRASHQVGIEEKINRGLTLTIRVLF